VQVQAVLPGQQAVDQVQVAAQLLGVACLARIIPSGSNAPAQLPAGILEPADIIPLPAVQ